MKLLGRGLDFFRQNRAARIAGISVLTIAVTAVGYNFMPLNQVGEDLRTMAVPTETVEEAELITYDYYSVSLAGERMGYVPDEASAVAVYDKAYDMLVEQIGYDPELESALMAEVFTAESYDITDENELIEKVKESLFASIDDLKVKAYVMKIGEEFVVSVESEEALTAVLEGAQSLYVDDDSAITVSLVKDPYNSQVMVPEVVILQKELPEERIFLTAQMLSDLTGVQVPDEEGSEGEMDKSGAEGISGDGSDAPMEDLFADDSEFVESVVKDVVLEQSIVIVETFISQTEIRTVEEATELITKENEKEKIYTVEKGDCPSIIAVENGMSTRDLYNINPGLEENANKMQIGDEVVVMKPEPELFVTTVEDVIYTEVIDRAVTYVNNPDAYIGEDEYIEKGSDGVLEVRATIAKVNGKETDRVIIEETVLVEPRPAKVLKGVKALPVTTATGEFDMPLLNYYFTSGYGPRWGRNHNGIDLAAPTGTNVLAADGGRIIRSGWHGALGYMIEIDHGNGLTSVYGHNSKLYVSIGEEVAKYQVIAAVGSTGNSTGPHCHFEIRVNGKAQNPMNYLK